MGTQVVLPFCYLGTVIGTLAHDRDMVSFSLLPLVLSCVIFLRTSSDVQPCSRNLDAFSRAAELGRQARSFPLPKHASLLQYSTIASCILLILFLFDLMHTLIKQPAQVRTEANAMPWRAAARRCGHRAAPGGVPTGSGGGAGIIISLCGNPFCYISSYGNPLCLISVYGNPFVSCLYKSGSKDWTRSCYFYIRTL